MCDIIRSRQGAVRHDLPNGGQVPDHHGEEARVLSRMDPHGQTHPRLLARSQSTILISVLFASFFSYFEKSP